VRQTIRGMKTVFFTVLISSFLGGNYPTPLVAKRDIDKAPADTKEIAIAKLPLELYPHLAKFKAVRHVIFFRLGSPGANDQKLKALASLNLTNLQDIDLVNSRSVTDAGIHALSTIKSLKSLSLENTGITDAAAQILAQMPLTGVNVYNTSMTATGLTVLVKSPRLESISFSVLQANEEQIVRLIELAGPRFNRIHIHDRNGTLNEPRLKAKGSERNIKVFALTKDEVSSFSDIPPGGTLDDLFRKKPK
jgi:hypothetical protein